MKTHDLVALARRRGWSLRLDDNGVIKVSSGAGGDRDPHLLDELGARKTEVTALLLAEETMVEIAERLRAVGFEIDRITAVREVSSDDVAVACGVEARRMARRPGS